MTTLVHPTTGSPLKLGRNPPLPIAARRMHLPIERYIRRAMPRPPDQTTYATRARSCLKQIMRNDVLSCCTSAAAFHILGSWFGNAGHPVEFANAQIEAFYSRSTGYVPGKPSTDQGGDEITVLDCWRDHGLIVDQATPAGRRKILGHLVVDATNRDQLKLAIWLFLNLYFGVSLPDEWVGKMMPAADGAVWPVAGDPDPNNGHAFAGVDFSPEGVIVDTWGILVLVPWDAVASTLR